MKMKSWKSKSATSNSGAQIVVVADLMGVQRGLGKALCL